MSDSYDRSTRFEKYRYTDRQAKNRHAGKQSSWRIDKQTDHPD